MSLPSAMIGMWLLVSVFVALHGLGDGAVDKGSRALVLRAAEGHLSAMVSFAL